MIFDDIINLFCRSRHSKVIKTIEEPQQNIEPKIEVNKCANIVKLTISEGVSFGLFFEKIKELDSESQKIILQLPISILDGGNETIRNGTYSFIKLENIIYYLVRNKKEILIDEFITQNECIEERYLLFNFRTTNFRVSKSVHSQDFNTQECRIYDSSRYQENNYSHRPSFILSVKEAENVSRELFDNLFRIESKDELAEETKSMNEIRNIVYSHFSDNLSLHKKFQP